MSVEKCAEIKGDCVEKQQICFISVTLKSWSDRKILGPTAYMYTRCIRLKIYGLFYANKLSGFTNTVEFLNKWKTE